ncbi:hypothetical protein K3495_g3610 [Podosphaera aphanis]|nr:hypothetical protein K3495_g3610 [Podosphaera aphanis]
MAGTKKSMGDAWMRANAVVYDARRSVIRFGSKGGLIVRAKGWEDRMSQNSKAKINYPSKIKKFSPGPWISIRGNSSEST